ncbi:hypothetical protein HK104_006684 [Borealophlyctis nickersoniae]|nr:hypothetical protein HK104_006684 [Borealophlyctis nickersoniae]
MHGIKKQPKNYHIIKIRIKRHGSTFEYKATEDSTAAHLMQAIATHLGAQTQDDLRYHFLGLPALTAMQFVNVDILALIELSPRWTVEVEQLKPPTVEALPTPALKRKVGDADLYFDDGGKGDGRGKGQKRIGGSGGKALIREGGRGSGKRVKVEAGDEGERGKRVKVEDEGIAGGGGGGGVIQVDSDSD